MTAAILLLQVSAAMPLLEQGDFAGARPILERACANREKNGCYLLGRTYFTLDQYQNAIRTLLPLLDSDPYRWRVEDALALAYEAMRQSGESETYYRAAVKGNALQTPDPAAHYGRFLVREGRTEDAITILAPASSKFPNNQQLRFELGRAYFLTRRFREAEGHLGAAPDLEEARRLLDKIRRRK